MKILFAIGFMLATTSCLAQFRNTLSPNEYFHSIIYPTQTKTFIPNVLSDPVRNVRQTSPLLTNLSYSDWRSSNTFFWTGAVTTMSYNKGKFGTLYYWDVQGNLRGTRGFIDISGKDKRGFKLVFPWKIFR
jgi:hypothetical protein